MKYYGDDEVTVEEHNKLKTKVYKMSLSLVGVGLLAGLALVLSLVALIGR